jgi:hypothetical protein
MPSLRSLREDKPGVACLRFWAKLDLTACAKEDVRGGKRGCLRSTLALADVGADEEEHEGRLMMGAVACAEKIDLPV